jgi:hypothetical protein
MHKRDNAEAPARRYRGTSAAMSRRQRGHFEVPLSRRYRLLVPESAVFCAAQL